MSWAVLYSVCLPAWSASGGQEVSATSPPTRTPDTLLLVDFDGESRAASFASGEARAIVEGGRPAEGRFGPGSLLGPGEMVSYDAAGNIDLNRGTLELWVNEDWSPQQQGQTHHLVAHPLDWMAPGNIRLWYWAAAETTGVLRFDCHAIAPHGNGYIIAAWPGHGWHHIAARWDCRDGIALYVDGAKVAEQRGTWTPLPPAEGVLEVSHPDRSADAVIDGLRIRGLPAYAPDEPVVRAAVGEAEGPSAQRPRTGTIPIQVTNRRAAPFSGTLDVAVRDYFGNPVGQTNEPLRIDGYAEHVASVRFASERPNRYFVAHVQVADGGAEAHVDREYLVTTGSLAGPRKAVCLDGEWECADGAWGDFTPPLTGWSPVLLPRKESRLPTHIRWYRRHFELPPDFGEQVRLVPRHVKQAARWWVNGIEVGLSEYAYVPYSFDIGDVVRRGEDNEVLVAVMDWVDAAQPELQAHLATTDPASGREIEGKPLLKPSGGEVVPAGIIESVWVYGHGSLWLSDIAVVTSTRERTIAVRGTVHNSSDQAAECHVVNEVFEADTPRLSLPATTVSVPGRDTGTFEVAAPWLGPRLWWPQDPYLYRLHTTVDVSGAPSDAVDTRFGFREFRAEGDRFVLNETPMHLFATSSWPNCVQMGWPGRIRDRWQETKVLFESVRESGHDIFRAHTEPWSDLLADLCDEVGLLLVTEGIMSSIPGRYNWDHPETMEHFRRFCCLWPRREMNHPSLVIRSIENEIGYLLQEKIMAADSIPRVRDGFIECGRIVREIDPSRPIMYEGSGPAFYDAADVYNNHYPADEYRWPWYPNASYWPGRARDTYFTRDWTWDRQKPLYMGEWGWFPGGQDEFAAYMGPSVYMPGVTYGYAKSVLWSMGIEGMRYYGVSAICPWTALEGGQFERITHDRPQHKAVREGFAKLKVAIRERGSVYFAGRELKRTVSAYNDTLQPQDLTVRWRLTIRGDVVEAGRWTESVAPAGTSRRAIALRLPHTTAETSDGRFEAELRVGGRPVSSAESRFRVCPRLATRQALTVGSIGLVPTTQRGLERLGVAVRPLDGVEALGELRVPLVIGPRAELASDDAPVLRHFVEEGGQIVVLAQAAQPEWLPADVELVTADPTTRYFVTWPSSPLMAGLTEADLSFWPEDHVVSDSSWRRPHGVRYRPVVSGGIGLRQSPLAEVRLGAGRIWLLQLPLWTGTPANPVTERLGHNLLGELRRFSPDPPGAIGLIAAPYSDTEALLADVGARPVPLAGDLGTADLSQYACIVIDAAPQPMADVTASAGRMQEFVRAGGTVWIHRVRPETASAVSALCDRRVELSDSFDLPIVLGKHPLLAGMSAAQFYWPIDPARFTAVRPGMVQHVAVVEGGVPVTDPPALVEVSEGGGRFLVDQLGWDDEFRNRDRAKELVAGLCTNVGVELAPPERAPRGTTFIAQFEETFDASYAAGKPAALSAEGASFVDGRFGRAVAFADPGAVGYARRLNLDINSGTVELWYRGDVGPNQLLFATTPGAFDDPDFMALWIWEGRLRFDHHSMPGGPGTGYILAPLQPTDGWQHFAATWDRDAGIALYIDGRQVAAQAGQWDGTEARFAQFTLSAMHRPVAGALDEVRILNYALTSEQVAADAAAEEPFTTPSEASAGEWVPGMAPPP